MIEFFLHICFKENLIATSKLAIRNISSNLFTEFDVEHFIKILLIINGLHFSEAISPYNLSGFEINVESERVVVRFVPLLFSMDLPAKAHFMRMNHHNGAYGCKDCLIEGKHETAGKGSANVYPYEKALTAAKRTNEDFKEDARAAFTTGKTVRIQNQNFLLIS